MGVEVRCWNNRGLGNALIAFDSKEDLEYFVFNKVKVKCEKKEGGIECKSETVAEDGNYVIELIGEGDAFRFCEHCFANCDLCDLKDQSVCSDPPRLYLLNHNLRIHERELLFRIINLAKLCGLLK